MNDIQRKADFYAKLANIEDLAALSRFEKEQLMVDAVKVGLVESVFAAMKVSSKDKRFMASWEGSDIPGLWVHLWDIHPHARKLICSLVDTGEVDVREFEKEFARRRPEIWHLDKVQHRIVPIPLANGAIFFGLEEVIRADRFPFSRCDLETCRKIFVPGKNQKYCGKPCAMSALAPWKARYMKQYFKEKRQAEKRSKRK